MTGQGIGQILVYAVVLIALSYPLGIYMARVSRARLPRPLAGRVEGGFYRLVRTERNASRTGRATRRGVLVFSVCSSACSTRSSACRAISS